MTMQPDDILMQAWKQQVDGCQRTIDTLVEAATKLRALQLEAAANADAEKCAAYWRKFYELGAQMQARLAQCMVPAPAAAPAAVDESKQAGLRLIDQAYKQWLETAQQLYKLPIIPS
jgi:hypothetical protein